MLLPLIRDFTAESPIVFKNGRVITQGEFLAQVQYVAKQLPDVPYIVNLCRDRFHFSLVFCACVAKGITSLLPQNRQASVVADLMNEFTQSRCVADNAADMHAQDYIDVNALLGGVEGYLSEDLPLIDADFIAAIAFTSGSTGKPTPNQKRWATLSGTASLLQQRLVPERDFPVVIATVPSQHMYGLEMTLMMALYGYCVMSSSHPFYPQDVIDELNKVIDRNRLLVSTPVHLRAIVGAGVDGTMIGKVVSATAPLVVEVAQQIETQFSTIVEEIYGCTEAGSMATRRTVSDDSWLLLDGMEMVMADGGPVVSGPQLDGERSLQDNLEYLGEGRFRFVGRSVDMINVGGKRASLADLTQKLLLIDGVDDAIVFAKEDQHKNSRPVALVVSSNSEREILEQLEKRVDAVFLPRPLKRVDHIPRNETGKVSLPQLRELVGE